MTMDSSKVQNGTLKCANTNDSSLDFDARTVGDVYDDFKILVKTIRNNVSSRSDINAFVTSYQDEMNAVVCVIVGDDKDEKKLTPELTEIMRLCRNRAVSHRGTLKLRFFKPVELINTSTYKIPWDDVKEARELKLKEEIQAEEAE